MWACTAGYDLRILFELVQHKGAEAILLLTWARTTKSIEPPNIGCRTTFLIPTPATNLAIGQPGGAE